MKLFKVLYYISFLFIKYKIIRSGKKRYFNLFIYILKKKPTKICEIGVYTGERSYEIIKLSSLLNDGSTIYYGYDLFEDISKKMIKKEFSKQPLSKYQVKKNLDGLDVHEIKLIKGNTLITLNNKKNKNYFDMIFIDGGHSINTIKCDFLNLKEKIKINKSIIFDDYYYNKGLEKKAGCNFILKKRDPIFKFKIFKGTDYHNNDDHGRFGISLLEAKRIK